MIMTLEDHLGDILRKARLAAQVSVEAAATTAEISAKDYQYLEETGSGMTSLKLHPLAILLGLAPEKLQGIADGWTPTVKTLDRWRELRMITTAREGLAVHCYLIWDEVTREAAIFDTGWEAAPIFQFVKEHDLEPKHLFLTHSHEDHLFAMGALRMAWPKLRIHTNSRHAPPQNRNRPQDFISLGSLRISNREVPGHAEDGVIYLIGNWPEDAPHVAIVGDTLFAGSMATGFQSAQLLRETTQRQILSLPPETLICPGHGPLTTVAEETEHNPFF